MMPLRLDSKSKLAKNKKNEIVDALNKCALRGMSHQQLDGCHIFPVRHERLE